MDPFITVGDDRPTIRSKYPGRCRVCTQPWAVGATITKVDTRWYHQVCAASVLQRIMVGATPERQQAALDAPMTSEAVERLWDERAAQRAASVNVREAVERAWIDSTDIGPTVRQGEAFVTEYRMRLPEGVTTLAAVPLHVHGLASRMGGRATGIEWSDDQVQVLVFQIVRSA